MELYLSTVIRTAPIQEGGEIIRFNWDTKTIEARAPIYPDDPAVDDPNPRGNTRGGRGIAVLDQDRVLCASYHTLKMFDRNLRETYGITHPMMANLHELALDSFGRIFAACTSMDTVLEIDIQKGKLVREYHPREMAGIQQALGVQPLDYDPSADNRIEFVSRPYQKDPSHLHINGVARWCEETFALSNVFGAVLNLDRGEVVLHDPCLKGAHNLVINQDHILVNDTIGRKVKIYDRVSGQLDREIDLLSFPELAHIKRQSESAPMVRKIAKLKHTRLKKAYYKLGLDKAVPALPLFVRGLDQCGDSLFVGFSPATVAQFHYPTGKLLDLHQFSRDVNACVHGLQVVR
jgi:hypothetical protein